MLLSHNINRTISFWGQPYNLRMGVAIKNLKIACFLRYELIQLHSLLFNGLDYLSLSELLYIKVLRVWYL